jgi:glycosyltransferase involved in cell wall biosynthesis
VTTFRPLLRESTTEPSVSIIVAARNEAGNIIDLVDRLPIISSKQELIFVEGGSKDATWEVIQEVIEKNSLASGMTIRSFKQSGIGKGDAVRLGFSKAIGDILIILDADISVPPEELMRFVDLIRRDKCEFANGSRLVYPMDRHAMQFLNLIGNRLFGVFFSFLIGQSVRDTLCGTKALWASDYARIADQRGYFGDIDPFGDFDLLFGASRLGLKIRDIPVHYKERVYGSTNISRFRHGFLLIRMTGLAARRLKFN